MATAKKPKKKKHKTAKRAAPEQAYSFRPGARKFGVPAGVIVGELARIANTNGNLTPEAVVTEAAEEDHPLHPAFEWDDETAGHQYRLWQARSMIRSVYVTVEKQPSHPVFVHVTTEEGPGYQPVEMVVRNPDMLASAMEGLQAKLVSASRSVVELRELAAAAGDSRKAEVAGRVGKHLDAAKEAAAQAV